MFPFAVELFLAVFPQCSPMVLKFINYWAHINNGLSAPCLSYLKSFPVSPKMFQPVPKRP